MNQTKDLDFDVINLGKKKSVPTIKKIPILRKIYKKTSVGK